MKRFNESCDTIFDVHVYRTILNVGTK